MISTYWQYFLVLDQDMQHTSRFIEISEDNYQAYSLELAQLFQSACAEIDTLAKEIYKPTKSKPTIIDHQIGIKARYPSLPNLKILVPSFGLQLDPWSSWGSNSPGVPTWWADHNDVKHDRVNNFAKANLKNAIDSIAALFALNIYYYVQDHQGKFMNPWPTFFSIDPQYVPTSTGAWIKLRA